MSRAIKVVLVICLLNVFMTAGLVIYGHSMNKASTESNQIITEMQADTDDYEVYVDKKSLEVIPATWADMADEEGVAHAGTIGVILYTDDKTDFRDYAGMAKEFADNGCLCVVPKKPISAPGMSNRDAKKIIKEHPEVKNWIIGGHGSGGKRAAKYMKKHRDQFVGVFFLSSYLTDDISDIEIPGVVIYGDKDGVMDMKVYLDNCLNYPDGTDEYVIKGGNYSQFAGGKMVQGDKKASISAEEQQKETVEEILKLAN